MRSFCAFTLDFRFQTFTLRLSLGLSLSEFPFREYTFVFGLAALHLLHCLGLEGLRQDRQVSCSNI
jgi:hypothetical protein